jgi:hypothetical protein
LRADRFGYTLPTDRNQETPVSLTVQLDPPLELRLQEAAQRLGVSPDDYVRSTLEQALGVADPADIYRQVCSFTPMGDADASENVGSKVKAKLRADRSD